MENKLVHQILLREIHKYNKKLPIFSKKLNKHNSKLPYLKIDYKLTK
jgi:hypothetical protein